MDDFIDANNYDTAFSTLKNILNKNAEYTKLVDLKILMESDLSANEKMLIVDKFKTIFSYIVYLSDGKNDGTNLSALISSRKNAYKNMK